MMGSKKSEPGRKENETRHKVTLSKGFWILETQVTQEQWKAVMGNNPSYYSGAALPVEQVSWNDCQEFCKKLSDNGLGVSLPTEAQWEYACRAGTTKMYSGYSDRISWSLAASGWKSHTVGTRKPNDWGIYDMLGNVYEWCSDLFGDYPSDDVTNPTGPSLGVGRVCRGGCMEGHLAYCRVASRNYHIPGYWSPDIGFRLILVD